MVARSTVPRIENGRPNIAAARSSRPCNTCCRIAVELIISSPSLTDLISFATNPYVGASASMRRTSPARSCPNRKRVPTQISWRGWVWRATVSINCSGGVSENGLSNVTSRQASAPSFPISASLCSVEVSNSGAFCGWSTRIGCGSNVSTTDVPPLARAWSRTGRSPVDVQDEHRRIRRWPEAVLTVSWPSAYSTVFILDINR